MVTINFKKTKNTLLSLLFPQTCLSCKKEGEPLCQKCLDKIPINTLPENRFPRTDCIPSPPNPRRGLSDLPLRGPGGANHLARLLIISDYNNKTLQRAIHLLKYQYIESLGDKLSELIIKFVEQKTPPNPHFGSAQCGLQRPINSPFGGRGVNITIPIPLHKKRLKERCYNQSELIAKKFCKRFKLELNTRILIRKKKTQAQGQKKLSKKERVENMKNAFEITNPEIILGKKILLIDDVYTTGSTMQEAAKTLKNADAGEVWGLVLAHG